jgi:hypothetical protein
LVDGNLDVGAMVKGLASLKKYYGCVNLDTLNRAIRWFKPRIVSLYRLF